MAINITDQLNAATVKGKIADAKQVFLDGDEQNVEDAIKEIKGGADGSIASLKKEIDEIKGDGTDSIGSLKKAITDESTNRTNADADINRKIGDIDTKIDDETKAREDALVDYVKAGATGDVSDYPSDPYLSMLEQKAREQDEKIEENNKKQQALINEKQLEIGAMEFDTEPTEGSGHGITSGGVFGALLTKNQICFTDGKVGKGKYNANQFIKEIYIDGWDGMSELIIDRFITSETIISIYIRNNRDSSDSVVLRAVNAAKNNVVKLSGHNNSGLNGYIVIDYNFLSESTPIHYGQNGISKCPSISRHAMSLSNCPTIYNYLHPIVSEDSISETECVSTKLAWNNFVYHKKQSGSVILGSWNTTDDIFLEKTIYDIKVIDSYENIDAVITRFTYSADDKTLQLSIRNNETSQWILYNTIINIDTENTKTYTVSYGNNIVQVTIVPDLLTADKTLLNKNITIQKTDISEITQNQNNYTRVFENVFKYPCNKEDGLYNILRNGSTIADGLAITKEDNGVRICYEYQDENKALILVAQTPFALVRNHTYVFYVNLQINYLSTELNLALDGLNIVFSGSGKSLALKNFHHLFNGVISKGIQSIKHIQIAECYKHTEDENSINNITFQFYNNNKITGKLCDFIIKNFLIVDLGELSDADVLNTKTSYDFINLFNYTNYFDTLAYNDYPNIGFTRNMLYQGLKLKSLGDSIPETKSFQPYIANALGMIYNAEEEGIDETLNIDGHEVLVYRSTKGGTTVAPVSRSGYSIEDSIYMRAKSLKYRNPDVLLIVAGYNDARAGVAYVSGGTYVQPEDYGINDPAYHGDGVDLVSDNTLECPSFGASYRGMIENILEDLPQCRLILCGVPRGYSEAGNYGKPNDWNSAKNKVIEQIAKEYGFPYISLADVYGVNKFNVNHLTKDNLHPSLFGGRRIAMEILAKAF